MNTLARQASRRPTRTEPKRAATATESAALAAGGIGAFLAGVCCVVPFVLVSVGVGGAWLANLQAFAPYRPLFIGVALTALTAMLLVICPTTVEALTKATADAGFPSRPVR